MEYDPNLIRSVAEPVILKLVAERAMYGYEIIKLVNERTDKSRWQVEAEPRMTGSNPAAES